MSAALDLFVEPLKHVGRLHMFVMLARQSVESKGLADIRLDSIDELRVLSRPLGDPGSKIALRFFAIPPIVEPP